MQSFDAEGDRDSIAAQCWADLEWIALGRSATVFGVAREPFTTLRDVAQCPRRQRVRREAEEDAPCVRARLEQLYS